MNRLELQPTPLAGLTHVVSRRLGDERGHLARVFCVKELRAAGWSGPVAQANITHTRQRGSVRGLHFQHPPHAEMKLVRCLRGEVWDVVVDLRQGSPSFLQWHAQRLSADRLNALLIPEGFAHGFQTLSDDVEMLYLHSQTHEPDSEGGLNVLDPRLAVNWPLPLSTLSERDRSFPFIAASFEGLRLP